MTIAAEPVAIGQENLTLASLRRIHASHVPLHVGDDARAGVERSRQAIEQIVTRGRVVYGINTGFGRLAGTAIPTDELNTLQRNLVLSHCTGTGPLLDDDIVRVVLVLKIQALSRGLSGVRWELIDALHRLHQAEVYPCVPGKGSVGASGDLAPLAHLSATLLGVGTMRHRGTTLPAREGLALAGLTPMELGPKEGLALLNGTQVSTALALAGLFRTEDLFDAAIVTGSMAVDAIKGSDAPFDERIHAARGQPGQIDVAAACRSLVRGSKIRESHLDCDRVQDPYSIRCQPQVMGACLDHLRFAAGVLEREANAVTDNPLVFPDDDAVLSGGNFHAEPVAMAADTLALVIAEIGALAERRIALLIDADLSGLPPFLVEKSGVNSGFMVAHVTAAALASENKSLAHPASVDSLPTSANQEDHVSMATFAARRLHDMADNTAGILAIELLAAAQGIEFHRPLRSSDAIESVIAGLRTQVLHYDRDRYFARDIDEARAVIVRGELSTTLSEPLVPSRRIRAKPALGSNDNSYFPDTIDQ